MKVDCDSNITKEKGWLEHTTEVREYNKLYLDVQVILTMGFFLND